jgi:hypothetical protein
MDVELGRDPRRVTLVGQPASKRLKQALTLAVWQRLQPPQDPFLAMRIPALFRLPVSRAR